MTFQQLDTGSIDRLEQQRQALARHLAALEKQIVETGRHHAAISETISRLREKQSKNA